MSSIAVLKYLGNDTWLYRGAYGVALINAGDQPALNALAKEGANAVATVSARMVDGALTIEEVHDVATTAADGRMQELPGDAAKFLIGALAGAVFTHPVVALGAGLAYGEAVEKLLPPNPNANLDYAHEFNFEGSPYFQESNVLKVPSESAMPSEQHRTALRDQFRRSEAEYTNSLGPDGQPWGTPTRVAPNATTEWTRSPQPGQWLHTTRVQGGDDSETRITKSIDPARWQVVSEQVHERALGVERLVSTTDTMSGQGWTLDRSSGQMQPFTLDEEAAAQARMAPAVQNHRALDNQQLQQCHRNEAEQMEQSMHSVYALATGQASRPGSHADAGEAHADPLQRDQAIEAGMGTFRRATAELLSAREVMRERGMDLPEVNDVPDFSHHRTQAPVQMPNSQTQAQPQPQTAELTEQQQRHQQMAQNQLGPLLREHGHSDEQIQRVSAAAVSHAQQYAHRGPVHSFLLSRDGTSVAVLQESAPMSEFSVQEAQRQSPEQHLERAHAMAQQQELGRADIRREQEHAQLETAQRSMA